MAEEDGVAPETQNSESSFLSIGDIAEAAGVGQFFDNVSTTEQSDEVENEQEDSESFESSTDEYSEVEEEEEKEEEQEESVDSIGVKKRISKLIDARNKAQEEADELREKIKSLEEESLTKVDISEKGLDRFADVKSLAELKKREQDAEHLREWLLENPEGGDYVDTAGEEHEVDYNTARKLAVETDRDLRKTIPLVATRIQTREAASSDAQKIFPWMKDKSSPEWTEIKRVLSKNNDIKEYFNKDPYAILTLAHAIEGIKVYKERSLSVNTPQKIAPSAPVPSRAKSVTRKRKTDKKSLLQKVAASGDAVDAASYIESIL